MIITYHEDISVNGNTILFPHSCLNKEIQLFLSERNIFQSFYNVKSNSNFLFIYLDNGNRIDVAFN